MIRRVVNLGLAKKRLKEMTLYMHSTDHEISFRESAESFGKRAFWLWATATADNLASAVKYETDVYVV